MSLLLFLTIYFTVTLFFAEQKDKEHYILSMFYIQFLSFKQHSGKNGVLNLERSTF